MRSTVARWCSAHLDLACQAISMLQGKTLSQDSRVKVDGEVDYRGDGPMVKSGQKAYFYNVIVYEKLCQKP